MQNEIGVEDIKTLLSGARLIARVTHGDASVIFEAHLAEVNRKPPGGAESAEPGTGLRVVVRRSA